MLQPPASVCTKGQAAASSGGNPRTLSRGNWAWIPKQLVLEAAPQLGLLPLGVYLVLASFADDQQLAFPSLSTIARLLGVSRQQVFRAIEHLSAAGIVRKQTFPGPGRRRVAYLLTDPSSWDLPNPESKGTGQLSTSDNDYSQAEKHAAQIAATKQSGAIVSGCGRRLPEDAQSKLTSESGQLSAPDSNGNSGGQDSKAKPGSPQHDWSGQLSARRSSQENGPHEIARAPKRDLSRLTNETYERENRGVAALLDRRSAPGDEVGKALLIANLVEELRELDVRDPEDLIKTALRHGWTLGDLAEVVSCAAEYSIDGSLEALVGCSAPEWLADVIPRGPKAAWDVLRRLLERDLADPPAFPELAWMAGEPLGWRWWRWRLQGWLEVRRDEAAGDPRVERFLARPVEPPWEKEVRE